MVSGVRNEELRAATEDVCCPCALLEFLPQVCSMPASPTFEIGRPVRGWVGACHLGDSCHAKKGRAVRAVSSFILTVVRRLSIVDG